MKSSVNPNSPEALYGTKILDGVYVGDSEIAKSLSFFSLNHINHVVNCSKETKETFSMYGVKYFSLKWKRDHSQPFFSNMAKYNKFYTFVASAVTSHKPILFVSERGNTRAFCGLILFLMRR